MDRKNYKIAIIGPTDMVSGFKALGVEVLPAQNADEALVQLNKTRSSWLDESSEEVYAVVCIMEELMRDIGEEHQLKVGEGALPAIVILPGPQGSVGYAEDRLRKLSEKAIGSAII